MSEQLKSDFEGDQGTTLVFGGLASKERWRDIIDGIKIREGEWVFIGISWNRNRKVDYLQGIRRPRWATGIFYKWWYRRVLEQSIKSSIDYLTQNDQPTQG